MLLGDGGVAALPPVAEITEVREDDVAQQRLERERAEKAVERGVRGRLVEPIERRPKLVVQPPGHVERD
jgi:hypothetical protein